MTLVLFDYGNVISLPQPQSEADAMAAFAGVELEAFRQRYWEHRLDFDRDTLTAETYWPLVLGRPARGEELATLVDMDVASWSHPNEEVIAILRRLPRVALLSNAPASMADRLDRLPWIAAIERRFYSARLGLVKPDADIYLAVLKALGVPPEEVTFVDDRLDNIEGAERVGMVGLHFREAADLDGL